MECRKSSGHFTAATATRPENLKLLCSEGLKWYRSSPGARRGFCGNCGSTLFWQPDSGDRISIFAGSLDDSSGLSVVSHIYVQEKGDYYDIGDGLPQFAGGDLKLSLQGDE